jgi:protein SCO1/2
MNSKHFTIFFIAVLLGVGIIFAAWLTLQRPYTYNGSLLDPPLPAPDFSLRRANGEVFSLAERRGRFVLLFFGYTSCPDVCPTTLADFKHIFDRLGEQADSLDFVMVTVDPERDTLQKIQDYVSLFNPRFIGLSGDLDEVKSVWDAYGVFVEKEDTGSATGYLVSHTARVYVVDPHGNIPLTFPFGMEASAMAEDLAHLQRKYTQ